MSVDVTASNDLRVVSMGDHYFGAEGRTVFAFGAVLGPAFGQMVLRDSAVLGYDNPRERHYRISADEALIEFLDEQGQVTSRFEQQGNGCYVGKATDSPVLLYLVPLLSLEAKESTRQGRVLVNSTPKSGTYWLREALIDVGFQPTDIHFGGQGVAVDNRGLDEDDIHVAPQGRMTELDLELVSQILPEGSVSVSHVSSPEALQAMWDNGVTVINVTRDTAGILASLFTFKRDVVAPLPGETWREAPTLTEQLQGFTDFYGDADIAEVMACRATIDQCSEMPRLDYDELRAGRIGILENRALGSRVGSDTAAAFRHALARTLDSPTSTLSSRRKDPEIQRWAADLAGSLDSR